MNIPAWNHLAVGNLAPVQGRDSLNGNTERVRIYYVMHRVFQNNSHYLEGPPKKDMRNPEKGNNCIKDSLEETGKDLVLQGFLQRILPGVWILSKNR